MMNLKIATILTALSVAAVTHAVSLNFQSNGTSSLSGGTVTASNPNLTRYTIGNTSGFTFTSLNYSYTPVFAAGSATGTLTGTGTLAFSNPLSTPGTFTFVFGGAATRGSSDATANTLVNVSFSDLTFVLTPATGSAFGYVNNTGTFSGNKSDTDGSLSTTSFVSTLNPVPEPASVSALGLGALGLLRRRRKA